MISQAPSAARRQSRRSNRRATVNQPISLHRVVGVLQVALATRRIARFDERGSWQVLARGI
jgi:hypothetical protein